MLKTSFCGQISQDKAAEQFMGGAGLIDRHTTIVEDIKGLFFSTTVSEDVYTGKNRYVPAFGRLTLDLDGEHRA